MTFILTACSQNSTSRKINFLIYAPGVWYENKSYLKKITNFEENNNDKSQCGISPERIIILIITESILLAQM